MEMRTLRPEEMGQARNLWESCFQDHPAFLDWYFTTRFSPRDGLGIFLDGQLLCDLHLAPRKIKIRKKIYSTAYLIALATTPAFRHLGLAKALLTYALRQLAARNIFFTFLLPFNTEFYTRLGWGVCANHRLYYLPSERVINDEKQDCLKLSEISLNDFALTNESPWRFCEIEPDHKVLAEIYNPWLAKWDGALIREEQDWTCLLLDHTLDDGKTCLVTKQSGQPLGYALVLPSSSEEPSVLREVAYTNAEVKAPFLQYLSTRYAGSKLCKAENRKKPIGNSANNKNVRNPIEENRGGKLSGGNTVDENRLIPYIPPGTQPVFLGRITSVRQALAALPYPPVSIDWILEITDPLLPENSGQYQLSLTKGNMRVTRTIGQRPTFHCSIGALASLVMGSARPRDLVATLDLKVLNSDDKLLSELEALFPPTANFINEYF